MKRPGPFGATGNTEVIGGRMIKAARLQCAVTRIQRIMSVMLLTAAVLAVLPEAARAATDYTRPGPYLGLGVSGGLEEFNGGSGSAFGDSAGLTFRGGYRFTPYFALEGLYEYMDDFGFSATTLRGTKIHDDVHTHNFSLMGKGILPLGCIQPSLEFVQPYLTGGVGFLNANNSGKIRGEELNGSSATEFAGRVGAGIDLQATSQLALTLDSGYVLPTNQLSNLNYISFGMGVRYTF
jgi:outer membrane protein with beta-barrel domain